MLKPALSLSCAVMFFVLLQSAPAERSGDYAAYKFQYFSDNNDVRVATSDVIINKILGKHVSVTGSYLVDGITAASKIDMRGGPPAVDAVTSASRKDETRHQASGALTFTDDIAARLRPENGNSGLTGVSLSGSYGTEPDYTSKSGGVSISQELFQKNTEIMASYTGSRDRSHPPDRYVPLSNDAGWNYFGEGKRRTDRVYLNLTQILSSLSIASFSGEFIFDRGYLSRPYYVYEITESDSTSLFYHENLPVKRKSLSLSAQVNRYITWKQGASVVASYRFYRDSWEIESHTAAVRMYLRFARNLIISPNYRFYTQKQAFFYEDVYEGLPEYLTVDIRLGRFFTHTAGVKLIYELRDFIKPVKRSAFALYPVSLDIAANVMTRTGTENRSVLDSRYCYFPEVQGYRNFWLQTGIKCAF